MFWTIKEVSIDDLRRQRMEAYDRLPAPVREVIANSSINWEAEKIEHLLRSTPIELVAAAIRMHEEHSRLDHEAKVTAVRPALAA
jgi:hypothetical protein